MKIRNEIDYVAEIDTLTAQVKDLTAKLAANNSTKKPEAEPNAGATLLEQYEAITDPGKRAAFLEANETGLIEVLRTGSTTAAVVTPVDLKSLEAQYESLTTKAERDAFLNRHARALARGV